MAQNNSYINLDTQQQLIDDELRKAKARKDAEMIAKAKEDYENLMKFNYTQDTRNQKAEVKPYYESFEDNLPDSKTLLAYLEDPESRKILAEHYRTNAKLSDKDEDKKIIKDLPRNYKDLPWKNERQVKASSAMDGYKPTLKDYNPEEAFTNKEYNPNESAVRAEQNMKGYTEDRKMPINPSGVIAYDSKAANPYLDYDNENHPKIGDSKLYNYNGIGDKQFTTEESLQKDYPDILTRGPSSLDLAVKPKEEEQFYLKYITPQVNEALKAIADKDPSMLQLPEVKELLKRSKIAYRKQNDLLSIAPWTSNPEQTVQVANALREQGDKNLMDAAANLESIRDRQLTATKAMADDLTNQKQVLSGFGQGVLNMQGGALMQLPVTYEGARQSNEEANKIHAVGDANIKAAKSSLYDFITSATDAMIKPYKKDKAAAKAIINDIVSVINTADGASESAWYDTIDPKTKVKKEGLLTKLGNLKQHLNSNSQPELTARIKSILDNLAEYKTAMATEQQHRATAFNAAMRGNQIFNTVAEVGQKFKMPLTGIDPSLDFKYPGGLDNSKTKSSSNGDSNAEDQSNGDYIIEEDQKTGKSGKKPKGDPIKDEEIKLSKAEITYVTGIKLLNEYKRAAEKAANARADLKTNNTTQAAVDMAEGEMFKKRNKASDFIQDLLTAASNGNDTARVVLGALYQSRYSPQLDTLGSNGTKIISSGNVKYRDTKDNPNAILNAQSDAIQAELKKSGLLGYFQ